ncbi:MAG: hypothetical protein ACREJT_04215 [Myxococcota bacterium]
MSIYFASVVYGLLVFAGAATLGFVVAPALGIASGLFSIDAEARGFFSLLTLKGVPYLVGLSAVSGLAYRTLAARRPLVRASLLGLNVLVVWVAGASAALLILG